MDCINLQEQLGHRYRITFDELSLRSDNLSFTEQLGHRYRITFDPAYNPKHVPRDKLDPWTMQILCQRGVIYPHGGDLLVAEVEGRRVTAGGRDAGDGRDGCDRC